MQFYDFMPLRHIIYPPNKSEKYRSDPQKRRKERVKREYADPGNSQQLHYPS
ncbi:MAG: hypothetical protein ACLFQB_14215 [Chitinispirillaceae bacterium]